MAELIDLMAKEVQRHPPAMPVTWWVTVAAWAGMWGLTPEKALADLQGRPDAVYQGSGCWCVPVRAADG